jgi:hypothetical protein
MLKKPSPAAADPAPTFDAGDLAAAAAERERALVPQFKMNAATKSTPFVKRESRKPIPISNLKQAPRRTGKRG